MQFQFIFIGKTTESYLAEGTEQYRKKLNHYISSDVLILNPSKEKSNERALNDEAERILKNISSKDYLILLDEKGKQYSSVDYAKELQRIMNQSVSKIIFVTGSAY